MKVSDIKLGMRVTNTINDLTALIVGTPEYFSPTEKLVKIKYENSTRYEYQLTKLLEALPQEEQFPALGGTYVKPAGSF